jgi:hypothetical protein
MSGSQRAGAAVTQRQKGSEQVPRSGAEGCQRQRTWGRQCRRFPGIGSAETRGAAAEQLPAGPVPTAPSIIGAR